MPNQYKQHNVKVEFSFKGESFTFFCIFTSFEFDKNANFLSRDKKAFYTLCYIGIGLATIGVCVFCAVTSVAAFFISVGL